MHPEGKGERRGKVQDKVSRLWGKTYRTTNMRLEEGSWRWKEENQKVGLAQQKKTHEEREMEE